MSPQPRADETYPDPVEAPPPAEGELVRACLDGNSRAFDQLVHQHTPRIFNYVYQMTRHRQDAEDITQQTFIKAFNNLSRFEIGRPLIAWLLTIARRTALNHFRAARPSEEFSEHAAGSEPSPAHNIENRDQLDNLWTHARRVLSKREFEVLWLRVAEDLSIEETARVAGLTQTHVKILAFRARRQLMKIQSRL